MESPDPGSQRKTRQGPQRNTQQQRCAQRQLPCHGVPLSGESVERRQVPQAHRNDAKQMSAKEPGVEGDVS